MLYYITWLILIVHIASFVCNLGWAITGKTEIETKKPITYYIYSIMAFLYVMWLYNLMQHLNWI